MEIDAFGVNELYAEQSGEWTIYRTALEGGRLLRWGGRLACLITLIAILYWSPILALALIVLYATGRMLRRTHEKRR